MRDTSNRKLSWIIQPHVLFPVLAMVFVTMIWCTAVEMLRMEHQATERNAINLDTEMLETYEAQVVRVLRDIDHTLNLVKVWPERRAGKPILALLRDEGLLPPGLVFVVSIADRNGDIVESTGLSAQPNIADQDYFSDQRERDSPLVGRLSQGSTNESMLHFSRRLTAPDGSFDGVVVVAVRADYFVSGYDPAKLGLHGVLGVLGTDGVFRIRRSGDALASGDRIDYRSVVRLASASSVTLTQSRNSWDGVVRWVSAREVPVFPLAILVGLSVEEQMSGLRHRAHVYIAWSTTGSIFVITLAVVLSRLSLQLARAQRRESEARIAHAHQVEHLAYHDCLTGLANRSLFSKLLSQTLLEARRYNRQAAVAFLDLDRFKQINDTLGHEAGDQLLQEVAVRIKSCARESDTVARLGGDEFVVLMPSIDNGSDAGVLAQRILAAIARPFVLASTEFRVTASIGISTYPDNGLDEQTLKKKADIAMYHAKSEGKNNFQFYSDQINANSLERLTVESALRHALERNELRLHYQAKRDIVSGRITGMEALLRWDHPDLGTVVPLRFIPIAEEMGLAIPIGKWVLKTACAQNVSWQRQGLSPLSIAVNLTSRQFYDEHLLADLKSVLATTGMAAHLLELEIAESILTRDVENTLRILTALKALGIRIAIDDFGVGYSSVATLQRFPLDTVKIDRSFIRDITGAAQATGLADAIIAIGKRLSLTVVAQGVETKEQAEFLKTHACDELQGFYFDRPLPTEEFTHLLQAQAATTSCLSEMLPLSIQS